MNNNVNNATQAQTIMSKNLSSIAESVKVIVSDDTTNGIAIAHTLSSYGLFAATRKRDGEVLLETIRKERPQIIICDCALTSMDAVEVMKKTKEDGYIPIFIITMEYGNDFIERSVMEAGATYYMIKPSKEALVERVLSLISMSVKTNDPEDIELMVTDIIHQLGIPAHIKGYYYIRTGIVLSIENPELLESVTKLLYPTIAKEYNTTSSRVERAIRHAIEIAWERGNTDILNNFFGYTIDSFKGKPTNSEFLALITDRIRLKEKSKHTDKTLLHI